MTIEKDGFCVLPWISVQINQDGAVLPCCRTDEKFLYGQLKTDGLAEVWNSENARALRVAMMKGEKPPVCRECHAVEKVGGSSYRQTMNGKFAGVVERVNRTSADGRLDEDTLLHVGVRFSNVCNFRCRTCTPKNSTTWVSDARSLGEWVPSPIKTTPMATAQAYVDLLSTQIPTLREVYFAGGEPLLDEAHYLFLERLIELGRTDVTLSYNTNFSQLDFGRWNALELWSKFDVVKISASFDGVGATAEMIRKGCDWRETVLNFRRSLMLKNVEFSIHCTVSVLNVFHLPTAIDEWLSHRMIDNTNALTFNIVREPDHYSLAVLNARERELLRERYENYWSTLEGRVSKPIAKDIRQRMQVILDSLSQGEDDELRRRFKDHTARLDAIRKESIVDHVPELRALLNS